MKIVFINGVFDVLHTAHFRLLEYASTLGNHVVVALDSDERVKQLKGEDRPYHNLAQRKFNLESIIFVDEVLHFNSDKELEDLVKEISPDIMVVGSDYKNKKVIGSEYARELYFFERIPEFSTTKILIGDKS